MSVTFYLIKHQTKAKIRSPYFDTTQPEDSIFNPRFDRVDIYPTMNYSNSNAAGLLKIVGKWKEGEDLCGSVYSSEIQEFLNHVNGLEKEYAENEYVSKFLERLDWMLRVALELEDGIAWA